MKKLYTDKEYDDAKPNDFLSLECYHCGKSFQKKKKDIPAMILRGKGKYCSYSCCGKFRIKYGSIFTTVNCDQCGKRFDKKNYDIAKTKNNFCSHSCNATYNNTHKTTGTRRSKFELWVEEQLSKDYPDLKIKFNEKEQIGSELDIYVEDFKLAFELNGIFHYEPIYGENKLIQIQNNDGRKFQACLEKGIELCIIDISGLKYFKSSNAKKYYDIIKRVLGMKTAL